MQRALIQILNVLSSSLLPSSLSTVLAMLRNISQATLNQSLIENIVFVVQEQQQQEQQHENDDKKKRIKIKECVKD